MLCRKPHCISIFRGIFAHDLGTFFNTMFLGKKVRLFIWLLIKTANLPSRNAMLTYILTTNI